MQVTKSPTCGGDEIYVGLDELVEDAPCTLLGSLPLVLGAACSWLTPTNGLYDLLKM
jgi:hypothetical protein